MKRRGLVGWVSDSVSRQKQQQILRCGGSLLGMLEDHKMARVAGV